MRSFLLLFYLLYAFQLAGQYATERLPESINTRYDEICPVLTPGYEHLFFTRVASPVFNQTLIDNIDDLSKTTDSITYLKILASVYSQVAERVVKNPVASSFNQDIWVAKLEDLQQVFHPAYPINDALTNSICSNFGQDDEFILINQFHRFGGMQAGFSTIKMYSGYTFDFPKPLHIEGFETTGEEVNLSMSFDKEVIILAMTPEGKNDKDLFYCLQNSAGTYSKPKPIASLNSDYNDATPFINKTKTKLFFASDRPGGFGEMDIYESEKMENGVWTSPRLLNNAVNSAYDDSHPHVLPDEKSIYFNSRRTGNFDIYKATLYRSPMKHDFKLHVTIKKEGEKNKFPAELSWRYTDYKPQDWPGFMRTNGSYTFVITENRPMEFRAENRQFFSDIFALDIEAMVAKGIYEHHIVLTLSASNVNFHTLEIEQSYNSKDDAISLLDNLDNEGSQTTLTLNNIYFVKSKPEVTESSYPALDKLAEVLARKPNIIIRVEGHTDNVGDKQALMQLSQDRADAIRTYLLSKKVLPYQIETIGYGGGKPKTDNSTEALRSQNRRVEIRILKK